jgi:hypothetical protein
VLLDGTPLDDSRSVYCDGALVTVHMDDWNANLDLLYLDNEADDKRLPPLSNQDMNLESADMTVTGAYLKKKLEDTENTRGGEVHAYYLYKDEDPLRPRPVGDTPPGRVTNMVGALYQTGFADSCDAYIESGYQWGTRHVVDNYEDMEAWGVQAELGRTFADCAGKPRVHVGYEYLSGDDPGTNDWEQWDPMLAQWPHWGEVYAYRCAFETGRPGCYQNLERFNVGVATTLREAQDAEWLQKVLLKLNYHYLLANEHSGGKDVPTPYDSGDTRGHLFIGELIYNLTRTVSGRVDVEYMVPGSYYNDGNDAVSLRGEIVITIP